MAEKEPNTPSSSSQRESTFFFFLCKQSIFSLQSNLKLNYFTENPFRFTANLKPYQSHFSSLTTIVSNFDNVPDHAKTILTRNNRVFFMFLGIVTQTRIKCLRSS
ncbi:hypothetical protein QL285_027542 [Trifolium repens]|nr:hypothetical protein QL285_027542 [Trifolium repens]